MSYKRLIPWTRQPQFLAQINNANPNAKNIVRVVNAGIAIIGNSVPGGLLKRVTLQGVGFENTSNAAIGLSLGTSKLTTTTGDGLGDFSILLVLDSPSSATRSIPWCIVTTGQTDPEVYFLVNAAFSTAAEAGAVSIGRTGGTTGLTLSSVLDGKPHTVLFTKVGGTIYGYVDGVLKGSAAWSYDIYLDANTIELIGGYKNANWGVSGYGVPLVAGFNDGKNPTVAASLTNNPWQVFASLERNIYVESSGATAALTGTVTTATEADIVAGGKTIILTLTGDTWVAAGATFDAQRQNIINGIDSAQAEATGWDAVVKALQGVAGVVRTSNTVVTITLDAQATYDITATETVTATIPATALTGALALVASPTFQITSVTAGGWLNRGYWWGQTYGNMAR